MSNIKRGPKLAADIERLKNPPLRPTPAPKIKPTKQKGPVSKKTVQGHYHND